MVRQLQGLGDVPAGAGVVVRQGAQQVSIVERGGMPRERLDDAVAALELLIQLVQGQPPKAIVGVQLALGQRRFGTAPQGAPQGDQKGCTDAAAP